MTKPNGHSIALLLNSLASAWINGRGCMLDQATSDTPGTKILAHGPGFLYRWNDTHEPIVIAFIPEGSHPAQTEDIHQYLFLGIVSGGISLQSVEHPTQIISLSDPDHFQQLDGIFDEARSCKSMTGTDTCDPLSTIIAAQRLIALAWKILTTEASERISAKIPAKHRFVTELHDWLSGQLENSVKLGDTAKHFNKSPRQLIRILKETTGSGFAEHLTMHRLTLARNLLMRTDASIMEIARKSGFNSREQLIRSFSKAFAWTPLQFRKAWNKASLSNSDLRDLCQISERIPVSWHAPGQAHTRKIPDAINSPQTLVVANALHLIIELFSIDANGKSSRTGVLDRGAMNFITRDTPGSRWLVRAPGTGFERIFITPCDHSVAVISSDLDP